MKKVIFIIGFLFFAGLLIFRPLHSGLIKMVWNDHVVFLSAELLIVSMVIALIFLTWVFFQFGKVKQWWHMRLHQRQSQNLQILALYLNIPEEYNYLFQGIVQGVAYNLLRKITVGNYQDVINYSEHTTKGVQEKSAILIVKAIAADKANQKKLQLDFLIRAVNLDKNNALLLKLLWQCLYDLGAYEQALGIIFRLRKLRFFERSHCDFWESDTLVRRAESQETAQKSYGDFQKAVVLNPHSISARLGLFRCLKAMDKNKQALHSIESAWFYMQDRELSLHYLEGIPDHQKVDAAKRLASFAPQAIESNNVIVEAVCERNDLHEASILLKNLPIKEWNQRTYALAALMNAKLGYKDEVIRLCKELSRISW